MSPHIIANLSPEQCDLAEFDSAEAEEMSHLERLMLDREDYYQLGCGSTYIRDLGKGHLELSATIERLMLPPAN
jgi:hypothetical protein